MTSPAAAAIGDPGRLEGACLERACSGTSGEDILLACRLFALDPQGLVLHVRSAAGPAHDVLLGLLREALPASAAFRRCPPGIGDDRLLGGLDLSATLASGRRVAQRGLLAEADGGLLLVPMAERLTGATAARLCAALDCGELVAERDGLGVRSAARVGIVLLDEGLQDERPPGSLLERAAFRLVLETIPASLGVTGDLAAARRRLPAVRCDTRIMAALCEAAQALGIPSMRAAIMALRVARGAAALAGRQSVGEQDAMLAVRLVLGWRATILPQTAAPPPEPPEQPQEQPHERQEPEAPDQPGPRSGETPAPAAEPADGMAERVVEAACASLPADLLDRLQQQASPPAAASPGGRATAGQALASLHGRPLFPRVGRPTRGSRLALVETLRAAAPWQRVRRDARARDGLPARRVEVRADDFRVARRAERPRSVAIFVVDASGSAALHRLAEAKGAIERLLADCYVRRDRVALIAFRGKAAEILLPPTAALTRARRGLAGLPGGGGTPLAAGLESACALAQALRRRGETPLVVLMTDGRANVTRAGVADRARATEEAARGAAQLRAAGVASLLVDISPRAESRAELLAAGMGALYLKLPDSEALSRVVRTARCRAAA